jgi:hypothetical protein
MANANTTRYTVRGPNHDWLVAADCFSPRFNKTMTSGLDVVDHLSGSYSLITGTAVFEEANHVSRCWNPSTNGETILMIYICSDALLASFGHVIGHAPNTWDIFIWFMDQLQFELGPKDIAVDFVEWPQVYGYDDPHPKEYSCLPLELDLLASTAFHFRNVKTGYRHHVKVRLAMLSWTVPLAGRNQTLEAFQLAILFSHCINVSRLSYSVQTRTITCPTQPEIFHSVLSRQFYCDLRSESGLMGDILGAVAEYKRRGFKFEGFLDMFNQRFFDVAENRVLAADD